MARNDILKGTERYLDYVVILVQLIFTFVIDSYCGVVIKSLSHQLHGKLIFVSRSFLHFRSLVLEPNFDLRFVETQVPR